MNGKGEIIIVSDKSEWGSVEYYLNHSSLFRSIK